jgi:hypothetical protein
VANVNLAIQNITQLGVAPTYTGSLSISDVYRVVNNGKVIIHFKKTGAGACTVTFQTPRQVAGLEVAEHTVSVPATTGDRLCSAFDPSVYNAGGENFLEFTLSEITGLSVGVFQVEE